MSEENNVIPKRKPIKVMLIAVSALIIMTTIVITNRVLDAISIKKLENAEVGKIVEFGSYEQDNNAINGKEPIEWIVVDIQEGKALLLSKDGLDYESFNEGLNDVTWETCTLRNWLNDTFYNTAFSNSQKKKILTTQIVTRNNWKYGTEGGNDTYDRIFLFSIEEARLYLLKDGAFGEQYCTLKPTDYAILQDDAFRSGRYWLRSPGSEQHYATYVDEHGDVCEDGFEATTLNNLVRPALWVEIALVNNTSVPNENEETDDKNIGGPIQCEFEYAEAVSQIMNSFSRYIQLYINVTGGTGEYTYLYEVTKEGDIYPSFESEETELSAISFTVDENVALEVSVYIMDSEGLYDSFEYRIEKYQE